MLQLPRATPSALHWNVNRFLLRLILGVSTQGYRIYEEGNAKLQPILRSLPYAPDDEIEYVRSYFQKRTITLPI